LGPIGFPELLFILVLALLIFGPRRIPEIGRTLGKAMGEFRRATTDFKRTLNLEAALEDEPVRKAPPPAAPASEIRPEAQLQVPPDEAPESAAGEGAQPAAETEGGEDPPTQPIEPVPSPAGTEPRG
jgi:TatA/E family protein of Tat protein translocase